MGQAISRQDGELLIVSDSKIAISRLRKIADGDPTHDGAAEQVRDHPQRSAGQHRSRQGSQSEHSPTLSRRNHHGGRFTPARKGTKERRTKQTTTKLPTLAATRPTGSHPSRDPRDQRVTAVEIPDRKSRRPRMPVVRQEYGKYCPRANRVRDMDTEVARGGRRLEETPQRRRQRQFDRITGMGWTTVIKYHTILRTIATWGAWAWHEYAHGAPRERKLRDLEKWQYTVARGITHAPWGTRRDVVEGLANLESVETFVDYEAVRVEARALRFEGEGLRRGDEEKVYLRGSLRHDDEIPLVTLPSLHRDAERGESERHIDDIKEEGWVPVYTDGSMREEKAGAEIFWGGRSRSVYLGEEATVNDAELVAISEAMERVEGELMIVTDSRHAIQRMTAVARGDIAHDGATRRMRRAWEERIRRGDWDIAVIWVKAHRGISGNEKAGRAASTGTALQYKPEIITEAGQRQKGRRERAEERNRLKLTYRPLERLGGGVGRLAGLLGGKGLRTWRWHIREGDGPECRWCGEKEETTKHLLEECRVWKRRWPGGEEHVKRPPKGREGERDPLGAMIEMLGE
ncbi:RNase H-domain-containing protein [Kalaharituber pfeilii]|nr:RNase H-domain-containing protein [Kalaharituber pfeilii]